MAYTGSSATVHRGLFPRLLGSSAWIYAAKSREAISSASGGA